MNRILAEIDAQIEKLQSARALLAGTQSAVVRRPGPGRPKGSKNSVSATGTTKRRKLSPEGRKRIADAMKLRWAERKKSSPKS